MVEQELQAEAVRLLVLLRAILYTRRGPITTESNDSAARAATALYHRLCTWPSIGIGFQMMFPPAATWTRAVGLRGLRIFIYLLGEDIVDSTKDLIKHVAELYTRLD